MANKTLCLICLLLFTPVLESRAADEPDMTDSKKPKKELTKKDLIHVGGIIAGSLVIMRELHPVALGTIWLVFGPLATNSKYSDAANWTAVGGIAALGIYNLTVLNHEDVSKNERLGANVAGILALSLSVEAINYLFPSKPRSISTAIFPRQNGVMFALGYQF